MSAYNVRLYDYKHSQQLRIYTKAINQQSEDDKKADIKNNDKDEKEKEEQINDYVNRLMQQVQKMQSKLVMLDHH